jgi:hypothetical protein
MRWPRQMGLVEILSIGVVEPDIYDAMTDHFRNATGA